jgi:hypothetical protein
MLQKSDLRMSLESMFANPTADFGVAAERLATAYYKYSLQAQSCSGVINPASLAGKKELLRAQIQSTLMSAIDLATATALLSQAFAAYWMAPPVAFIGSSPGAVVAAAPATLAAALLVVMTSNPKRTGAEAADTMAGVLDNWTKTVVAAHTPPTPCTGPLT